MKLTLNIIISQLKGYLYKSTISFSVKRSYLWAEFPPADPQEMNPEILYLVDLDNPGNAFETDRDCHYLCIKSGGPYDDIPDNCLWIQGISDITELSRLVTGCFLKYKRWEYKSDRAIIETADYQRLLDAAEGIFDNPIYILDASYKLIAKTTGICDDDELDLTLVRLGYHPSESMEKIKNSGMIKKYSEQTGIIVNQPGNPNKYGTIGKWLWEGNMPVIHIHMVCSNSVPEAAMVDLFEIFTKYCYDCFKANQKNDMRTGNLYESLIKDMLFGDLDDTFSISKRAKVAHIPMTGTFLLFKLQLRDNEDYLIKRVYSDVHFCLGNAKTIYHKNEVIVLCNYIRSGRAVDEKIKNDIQSIMPFLKQYDGMCGISEPFREFRQIRLAYIQATKVIEIGRQLYDNYETWNGLIGAPGLEYGQTNRYVFRYEELFIYYLLSIGRKSSPEVYANVSYFDKVRGLIENDEQNDTNNAQILYVYLVTERRAARTAELLHMHRNNIVYHIPRIEKMLNLDLNNFEVRQGILLAYRLIELKMAEGRPVIGKKSNKS